MMELGQKRGMDDRRRSPLRNWMVSNTASYEMGNDMCKEKVSEEVELPEKFPV